MEKSKERNHPRSGILRTHEDTVCTHVQRSNAYVLVCDSGRRLQRFLAGRPLWIHDSGSARAQPLTLLILVSIRNLPSPSTMKCALPTNKLCSNSFKDSEPVSNTMWVRLFP